MIKNNRLLRIGVFYDGTYFAHVSSFYLHNHPRAARLSIEGLHFFVRTEVARQEQVNPRFCQIVDAHYFRGRLSARQVRDSENVTDSSLLFRERQFDDALIREGVTLHYLPMPGSSPDDVEEKGIDVWFALEAYELAILKKYDVVVLVTGDGDFVPLVKKLNTLGIRVMLLGWNLQANGRSTRTSHALMSAATYPVMMHEEIESRGARGDRVIEALFVKGREPISCGNNKPQKTIPKTAVPTENDVHVESGQSDGDSASDGWREGMIYHFVPDRGFGFIEDAATQEQFFFHISSLVNSSADQVDEGVQTRFKTSIKMHHGKPSEQATVVELLLDDAKIKAA